MKKLNDDTWIAKCFNCSMSELERLFDVVRCEQKKRTAAAIYSLRDENNKLNSSIDRGGHSGQGASSAKSKIKAYNKTNPSTKINW